MGCGSSKKVQAVQAVEREGTAVEQKELNDWDNTEDLARAVKANNAIADTLPPAVVPAPSAAVEPQVLKLQREDEEFARVLALLLPNGQVPSIVQYWLDFKKTSSTSGKQKQAREVLVWMIEAISWCHKSKDLEEAMRKLLSTERLICNLLFLGVWRDLKKGMADRLQRLGEHLLDLYKHLHLDEVFSDAEMDKHCKQNPEFKGKHISQALLIPGFTDPAHFAYDDPGDMAESVALHVQCFMTMAANHGFQEKVQPIASKYATFMPAPPKSYARMANKTVGPADYRFEAKPRSQFNIDTARNLVSASNPNQVYKLAKELSDAFGGYAKFKNLFSLPESERDERFHLLAAMMTVCYDTKKTFGEHMRQFDAYRSHMEALERARVELKDAQTSDNLAERARKADACQAAEDIKNTLEAADPWLHRWDYYIKEGMESEPVERWGRHTARALEFMRKPHLANVNLRLMCETQILLDDFVFVRAQMHEPYRVWRAANPNSLFHDFARSANGGKGNFAFRDDGSTLINACNRGQVNVVNKFLDSGKYGVDHANSANGCTGLYMACVNNHVDVVKTLIERGCDVNLARDTGATPVYIAGERGHTDVLKLLIAANADIEKARNDMWNPLINGARRHYCDVVEVLIEAKADVNMHTETSSPLHEAIIADPPQPRNADALRAAGAEDWGTRTNQ